MVVPAAQHSGTLQSSAAALSHLRNAWTISCGNVYQPVGRDTSKEDRPLMVNVTLGGIDGTSLTFYRKCIPLSVSSPWRWSSCVSKHVGGIPGQVLRVPGGWGFQISRQSAHEVGKVVSPTHRSPLPLGNIPGDQFCWRLSWRQGRSAARSIMSMKNSNDTIGNRTRDLPACSAVPQPTEPPRARYEITNSCL